MKITDGEFNNLASNDLLVSNFKAFKSIVDSPNDASL